jgi:hypothetical protein
METTMDKIRIEPLTLSTGEHSETERVVVESISRHVDRVWTGSRSIDYHDVYTEQFRDDEAEAYCKAWAPIWKDQKPFPIGSRFD